MCVFVEFLIIIKKKQAGMETLLSVIDVADGNTEAYALRAIQGTMM